MKSLFWISFFVIVYVYILYPVLIYFLSLFYKKPVKIKYLYPRVSVILPVYNEDEHIEEKLNSLLRINYPEARYEILVGSDGSTDRTKEIVETALGRQAKLVLQRIRFFEFKERKGKCAMVNFLVSLATGEILVFTRCRQEWDVNALEEIVRNFSDKRVGAVSGALCFKKPENNKARGGLQVYWKYEKFIRKSESRMGSMLGASGALYAIRKELYPGLPNNLILDDVYIPLKIVEKGYRALFDKKSKVYDMGQDNPGEEYWRKTRTLAGNFQLLIYLRELFNPLRGKISWQFFSHKFLRLIAPYLLIAMLVSNYFLINSFTYRVFFALQVVFYALALMGAVWRHKNFLLDVPHMFVVMNTAAVVGLVRFLARKQGVRWEKVG